MLLFAILSAALPTEVILEIGSHAVTKNDIAIERTVILKLFEKRYKRKPNADDEKCISDLKQKYQRLKLSKIVNSFILTSLYDKYADEVLNQEVINSYLFQNRKKLKEDLRHYMAFLEAADYIKQSDEKNKYEIAYQKFQKKGMRNSYQFFKSAVDKPYYLEFLQKRIKNLTSNELSKADKDILFKQKLFDYVLKMLSQKNEEIQMHLRLSEKHACNYKNLLYEKWFIEQGKKLGIKIHDQRYGNSLESIINFSSKQFDIRDAI